MHNIKFLKVNLAYLDLIRFIVSKKKSSGVVTFNACISSGAGGIGIVCVLAACKAVCSASCSLYFSHTSKHSKMLSA